MRTPARGANRRSRQADGPAIPLDRGVVTAVGLYLLTGSVWVTLIGTTAWVIVTSWGMWLRRPGHGATDGTVTAGATWSASPRVSAPRRRQHRS